MGLNLKIKILIFRLQFSFYPPFFSFTCGKGIVGGKQHFKNKITYELQLIEPVRTLSLGDLIG